MQIICEVCGNRSMSASRVCPFCGCRQEGRETARKKTFTHKTVNLEAGRPVADAAVNRMIGVIEDGARNDVTVVTLIHGYGSSGKGGVIRSECRKMLDFLKSTGRIRDYIKGEEFTQRSAKVRVLLQRYPQLRTDKNLDKQNRGITQVILTSLLLFAHSMTIMTTPYVNMIS